MTDTDDSSMFPITMHLPSGRKAVVTETGTTITPPLDEGPPLDTLDRALWRAGKLIELTTDKDEEPETKLSDVLADLLHWANQNHVNFEDAVASAEHARAEELKDWDVVQISITNTYEDGHESVTEVWVPGWGYDTTNMDDWWQDVVYPHTGDGHGVEHPKLGVFYEATIISVGDPNDTTMCGVTYDWQG